LAQLSDDYSGAETIGVIGGATFSFVTFLIFLETFNSHKQVKEEVKQAAVSNTIDWISLKAVDWPEQFTTDFKALNRPVEVVKTTSTNHWGLDEEIKYTFRFVPID
jgi:hypothetical protein